jgi:hypothetical protein
VDFIHYVFTLYTHSLEFAGWQSLGQTATGSLPAYSRVATCSFAPTSRLLNALATRLAHLRPGPVRAPVTRCRVEVAAHTLIPPFAVCVPRLYRPLGGP